MGKGEVRADGVRLDSGGQLLFNLATPTGKERVRTRLLGAHNAVNVAAAAAVAWAFGVDARDIAGRISRFTPSAAMRMERRKIRGGATAILDCYNANPDSMRAALSFISAVHACGPVLVLGEMLELGAHSRGEHAAIGRMAAKLNPVLLVGVGPGAWPLVASARASGVHEALWVRTGLDALEAVADASSGAGVVLLKGSRAVRLEQLADALTVGGGNAV